MWKIKRSYHLSSHFPLPSREEVKGRAKKIADMAERHHVRFAMIGGAPYLMAPLERELKNKGITPVYAFSRRESIEKEVEGKVIKTQVFQTLGLYKGSLNHSSLFFLFWRLK